MNKYTTSNSGKYNSFLSNSFKNKNSDKGSVSEYNYKDNEFPDLVPNEKLVGINNESNKKYLEVCSVKPEVILAKKNTVPPGWVQYSRPKGVCILGANMTQGSPLFDVTYGDKTKRQLEQEAEEKVREDKKKSTLDNPYYHYNKMLDALVHNWDRYKTQYDEIHGEGSYDLIYYTDPVYPSDEYFSDTESDTGNYNDSQEEYEY